MDSGNQRTNREGRNPETAEPAHPVVIPIQNSAAENAPQPAAPPVPRFVIWSHRLSLVVFVVFCIELGVVLAILPWLNIWNQNSFLVAHPGVRSMFQNNFLRGVATGLGLIDIWIGIWEAVHYHDPVHT